MKLARCVLVLLASTLASAAAAQAQSGRTRQEVLDELAEARRMGDTVIAGCGGGTLREAFPNRYPSRSVAATKPPRTDDVVKKDRPVAEAGSTK